ncbi:putative proteasome subunit alpha type-2 [Protomyces lactucae-debilis]|uniref:Proteasome subunit alpha type n=1 Tax=Protomyces lactucae-debilis TaxID=2754530 RepID=A0A1Y2FCF6_PROLT|nr:putative proteasome subunit alpha type-2 [Protomyces lactucae-debilis]ORY80535.1 putative proteasome subunit alpha type-2 [Protomyces lactucae-debilis]
MSYSFSLTTFSPQGKLGQIEHALAAVNQGVQSLGIKATNGIVLATEKKAPSSLQDATSVEKISKLTPNACMVYSGMGPDFRVLVDKARKASHAQYKRIYEEYPPTKVLVQEIAKEMQNATQSGGVRPYGVSVLVAGWDEHAGFQLFQVDPSGSYFPWKATAIGKSSTSSKTFLEKRYSPTLELEDAIHTALLTLKEGFEGEMTSETVEIAIIGQPEQRLLGYTMNGKEADELPDAPRFRRLTVEEVGDYLGSL